MEIYEIFGRNAHEMTRQLMAKADIAGKIPKGASVALKPNLVLPSPPEEGATTHPGVLSGCITYLREHGITDISVIEGSWVGAGTQPSLRVSGLDKVCRDYGVLFYDLKKDKTEDVATPFGKISICQRALHAGYLIDLPVLKGHCQTRMTCAIKNLKGCIPDREKRRFHAEGLTRPIAALACGLKPDLIIVDSICGDLDFEEGGNPVQTNRMFLGFDAVQVDAYACTLMGLELSEVPYILYAEQWGAGNTQLGQIIRLNDPVHAGTNLKPTGAAARLGKGVKADSACSACYASLIRALYAAGNPSKISIAIGQGWKDKPFEGLGIGRCCNCAAQQVKGCPPTAEAIVQALHQQ